MKTFTIDFMRNTYIILGGICFAVFLAYIESNIPAIAKAFTEESVPVVEVPLPPNASHIESQVEAEVVSMPETPEAVVEVPAPVREVISERPTRLAIPSIKLNSPVIPVGTLKNGEMAVPSGKTRQVGWFKNGTIPGNVGSAVMDAHVHAAFSKLKYAEVGDEVLVTTETGRSLRYRIINSMIYPKDQLPMETIFADDSGTYLNLITCAGKYIRADKTYTHRLVVYAQLVE